MRSKLTSVLLALALIPACDSASGAPEADLTLSPVELARALAADPQSAVERYGDQWIQLSGTVGEKVAPGGLNPTIAVEFAEVDGQLAFDSGMAFVSFDPEDRDAKAEFDGISVGEEVTLVCMLEALNPTASLIKVGNCRLAD